MKIKVNFNGKELERKLYTDRKGDNYIQHHNEKWLVSKDTHEIIDRLTTNTVSAMWEKQQYIDSRMHHLDKIPPHQVAMAASSLNSLNEWYNKEKDFLFEHYEVDASELGHWLKYAFETMEKGRK